MERRILLAAKTPAQFAPNVFLQANSRYFFVSVLLHSVIMCLPFLGYTVKKKKRNDWKKIEFFTYVIVYW